MGEIRAIDDVELVAAANEQLKDDFLSWIREALLLPTEEYQSRIDSYYTDVGQTVLREEDLDNLEARDKAMVTELVRMGGERILHVGGLEHIFASTGNMYELLTDMGFIVHRLKLSDQDAL